MTHTPDAIIILYMTSKVGNNYERNSDLTANFY